TNSTPTAEQGQMASITDSAGNRALATFNSDGNLTDVEIRPAGSDTTVDKYHYSYTTFTWTWAQQVYSETVVTNVSLSRLLTGAASLSLVGQVAYTYYQGTYNDGVDNDPTDAYGTFGNLK